MTLLIILGLIAFIVLLIMYANSVEQTECKALESYINSTDSDYAQKSWIDKECYAYKVKPARSYR